jgi:hypothetical protein
MQGRASLPWGIALLLIVFGLACHKNATPHPNQINSFDGRTYDTLISAQAALDEAKSQYRNRTLPQDAKQIINDAGAAYEQARSSWQLWRDVTLGLKPGDPESTQSKVEADMQQLAAAMASLQRIRGGR